MRRRRRKIITIRRRRMNPTTDPTAAPITLLMDPDLLGPFGPVGVECVVSGGDPGNEVEPETEVKPASSIPDGKFDSIGMVMPVDSTRGLVSA
jgi:hypothetical protein